MSDAWQNLNRVVKTPADAILYACILEATAPKPGNVHPTASFDDLSFEDFVTAANIGARTMTQSSRSIGRRVHDTVVEVIEQTSTNVNLGIALLLAPLIAAEESGSPIDRAAWSSSCGEWLETLSPADGQAIGQAIVAATPGGMDVELPTQHDSLDVAQPIGPSFDLMAGMRIAAERDAIAKLYVTKMNALFEIVVPTIESAVGFHGDVLAGIVRAHVELIARFGDTLIARKCGEEISQQAANLAAASLRSDPMDVAALDAFLRGDGHRRNPGTTADLIAAGLYVILRRPN
ncbi:MAG: triphosphoribosyl-dephospho-CoA synthase [Planctomycetota bacterium]